MAAATDYLEAKLLDHTLRNTAFTQPVGLYVSLHTTTGPTDAAPATNELSGNNYSRQSVTFGAATGTAPTVASNSDAQTFVASGGDWGLIEYMCIWDASTSGNGLIHGALTASRTVNNGDQLVFAIGDIDVSLA